MSIPASNLAKFPEHAGGGLFLQQHGSSGSHGGGEPCRFVRRAWSTSAVPGRRVEWLARRIRLVGKLSSILMSSYINLLRYTRVWHRSRHEQQIQYLDPSKGRRCGGTRSCFRVFGVDGELLVLSEWQSWGIPG